MASYSELPSGRWRAQTSKHGIRLSASFASRDEAEAWGKQTDAAVSEGRYGDPIQLTNREFLYLYKRTRERARQRGIAYLIERPEVERLFLATCGRCSVTGIHFSRFRPLNSTKRPWYPSLDRIDSSRPYEAGNVRFVCVAVNIAMCEWGEWVLKEMARAMLRGEPVTSSGPEAPPYCFAALKRPPTYRQEVRRRIRAKSRQMSAKITTVS